MKKKKTMYTVYTMLNGCAMLTAIMFEHKSRIPTNTNYSWPKVVCSITYIHGLLKELNFNKKNLINFVANFSLLKKKVLNEL